MISVDLKPTPDELENLRLITQKNLDNISQYTEESTLEFTLAPFHQELLLSEEPSAERAYYVYFMLRDLLQQGGRILLLTPDTEPQELTLEQEV